MFKKKQQKKWFDEFTVLGVFVAVAVAGLAYGALLTVAGYAPVLRPVEYEPIITAPTTEEYRAEAHDVLAPFLEQAMSLTAEDVAAGNPLLLELVDLTLERLLRVRVPKDHREAHLSFVLLLEQWKRALDGSAADQEAVFDRTAEVLKDNPWLVE